MRPQPMAGVAQYATARQRGRDRVRRVEPRARRTISSRAEEIVEKPNPELRLVARLVPWYNGLVVKADSPIKSIRDLKGQSTPAGFSGNPLGRVLMDGYLANAGLKPADTRQVLVPAFPRMFDMFKQGQLATSIATIGVAGSARSGKRWWAGAFPPVRRLDRRAGGAARSTSRVRTSWK